MSKTLQRPKLPLLRWLQSADSHMLAGMIVVSTVILFLCSSIRHGLFHSTAYDLGYFDQLAYLLSQWLPPVISFWGYHFLGGHADWIMYFVALPYKIYPSVFWLLAIQAIALAIGALPTYHLARQAGLKNGQSTAITAAYLLHPLIFNLNLFDFHPEVIALPLVLTSILAARRNQIGWFVLCLILILGCRDALSLTVFAMGFWLWLFEKRLKCGAIALILGGGWFLFATQILIPSFPPGGVISVARFDYLGSSVGEIVLNLFLKPNLVLSALFTLPNLQYLCLIFLPVIWGLSLRHLAPLIAIVPTLLLNLLSTLETQKDLLHQYSLPALPFLMVAIIAALADGRGLVQSQRGIFLCSLIGFLALAKFGYFGDRYLNSLDTWQATRSAITYVQPQSRLLTTAFIAPHLTHRPMVKLAIAGTESIDLGQFDEVLLNVRHPGWASTPSLQQGLVDRLQRDARFKPLVEQDGVYLFTR
ncbi:DUF2079 domain-containing protein [Phormidium sp. CLA17]|uniref:DUF2079 domain-containing protein n=1 Tax=Leptolyngbya sp. Cla-17 TaxID=2803751 RepID=UPI0018DA1D09|nr:DUF2079 domain-containing protein [Leptolyngbya sp. Cla-17]MBM0743070.1 DUF2079 domain-containing protein [Leptolyngbya sp. Cla-17]